MASILREFDLESADGVFQIGYRTVPLFQADEAVVRTEAFEESMADTRVCIISPEIVGPHANGGVGTHCYYLAAFLSRQLHQEVTFVYTGKIERHTEAYWRDWFRQNLGAEFVFLQPPREVKALPAPLRSVFVATARNVYAWLRQRAFDVCYFQDLMGNGFRCFQAKRLGLAFQDTVLTCTVHSSWEWICQAMQALPQGEMEEVQTKFMERYCVEHCDQLISPSEYMLRWLQENLVKTAPQRRVLPYLFDPELATVGYRSGTGKIIFFGRLEVRKGLLLFLEALRLLDGEGVFARRPIEVTFLGRSGYTPDGGGSASIEKHRCGFSPAVRLTQVTHLDHRQALEFLSAHNDALVVCPSLVDNSPYAVIESLQLGLNVIATNSGGIPELFAGTERLFEPEPAALAARIRAGLSDQLPPPAKRYDLARAQQLWHEFSEQAKARSRDSAESRPNSTPPAVRVFVAAGSVELSKDRALESLENQTFRTSRVTVISDACGPEQRHLPPGLAEYCQERGWSIQRNASAWNARATTPPLTGNTYIAYWTRSCYAEREMLACLVAAMEHSGLEALTCCGKVGNENGADSCYLYEPLGPCLEGGIFNNLFGAGCLILKLDSARDEPRPERLVRPEGMWAYLAEISIAGRAWDVCPDTLMELAGTDISVCPGALDYSKQMEVLERYSRDAPMWLRYLLVNAVAAERNLRSARPKPVLFKVQREIGRLLKQCRSLFRRT
ncbi:MAG TPA: glycosyltransferase family 4 protein [Candidatus Acidoferrum sp.]|nr:glycosyltransferase family 4 protein [Candidatus Acidoferrum sp.]